MFAFTCIPFWYRWRYFNGRNTFTYTFFKYDKVKVVKVGESRWRYSYQALKSSVCNVHTYAYFLKTINTEYTYLVFEESGIRTSSISQIKSLHPEWFIIILDPDVSFRMESNISLMGLYPTCRIKISTINTEHLK